MEQIWKNRPGILAVHNHMLNLQDFRAATTAPVVLYYPHLHKIEPEEKASIFDSTLKSRAPLAVLALAGPLEQAGYRVRIIDAVMTPDFEQEVLRSVEGAICLGLSCIAGYQVYEALRIAKLVRDRYPYLPLIWGGWFPSMLHQTIEDPHVDVVVRGQGEATFLELVYRLSRGLPIDDVRGIAHKKAGRVMFTPERPIVDSNQLPPLPYHLIDLNAHLAAGFQGKRATSYFTSYGCPYQCTFCSNGEIFGPRWYPLAPERVVDDIENLVKTWGVNHISLDDANFFVNTKRTRQICELIIQRRLDGQFGWDVTGTANVVSKFDEELLRLLKRCGLSYVFIGAETGSRELQEVFKKPITREQVLMSAEKLGKHDIRPYISFIVGVPGEPEGALGDTLNLAAKIYQVNSNATVNIYFFGPIPLVPLSNSPQVRAAFPEPPQTLEQWAGQMGSHVYGDSKFKLPHSYSTRVVRFRRLSNMVHEEMVSPRNFITRTLQRIALFRLKHEILGLPTAEVRLYEYIARRYEIDSLRCPD